MHLSFFQLLFIAKVPEINPEKLQHSKLIANPNCTTAIAAVVLWPLHKEFIIKKLIMSTYQASSGAGAEVRYIYDNLWYIYWSIYYTYLCTIFTNIYVKMFIIS